MAEARMALNSKLASEQQIGSKRGLEFRRMFTDGTISPYDKVEWEKRTALIGNDKGQTIFRQENVEVPKSWSQTATNIVASKYFHGKLNTPERETSVRQLIGRVADTIVRWGEEGLLRFECLARCLPRRAHASSRRTESSLQFAGVV
jgi:ribonucleoside-diphosphate reductase alpha chain